MIATQIRIEAATASSDRRRRFPTDLIWIAAAVGLVATATIVGLYRQHHGEVLFVATPPLFATFDPHTGPGTAPAIVIAVLAAIYAPTLARRLSWRALLWWGLFASIAWTVSLASIDLTRRPLGGPLDDRNEYLYELPRTRDVGMFLRTFTDHIVDYRPGSWTTHVSSHPPLATLFFAALDRLGLGGATWAALAVVVVGSCSAIAVPVTLRSLGAHSAARAVWPFVVFFPGAVWVGASADGMFMGVSSVGVALVAVGVTDRRRIRGRLLSAIGGIALGATLYLSYGLAALGVVVGAVAVVTGVRAWPTDRRGEWLIRWVLASAGVAAVTVLMTGLGFSWTEGLRLLHIRYYQGIATQRPYDYFVWANLAALCVSAGPACAVAIARSMRTISRSLASIPRVGWAAGRRWELAPAMLTLAALIAIGIADATGLSKAETERIWLPFGIWLICALALVPARSARWVLATQLGTALLVNHVLLTHW